MKIRIFLSLLITLLNSVLIAQESTLNPAQKKVKEEIPFRIDESIEVNYHNVLIVPFETKLYNSEIDKKLHEKSGLSQAEIRNKFRLGLNNLIYVETEKHQKAVTLMLQHPEAQKDLYYIYRSTGYKYKPMPIIEPKEESNKTKKFFNSVKKKADKLSGKERIEEERETRIKEGQLYSVSSKKEHFMDATLFNTSVLKVLSDKYETQYFIFVNQLDIKMAPGTDYRALQIENYQRQIKVHYTIFDREGQEIYGGAAKQLFSSKNNDIDRIIKSKFPKIATEIVSHLPSIIAVTIPTDKPSNSSTTGSPKQNSDGSYNY